MNTVRGACFGMLLERLLPSINVIEYSLLRFMRTASGIESRQRTVTYLK